MSYRQVSRVIYGFRIEAKIDRNDPKYLPHIEGHPGTDVLMFGSEEEPNVWYCGILLASSDDGVFKEINFLDTGGMYNKVELFKLEKMSEYIYETIYNTKFLLTLQV